MIFSTDLCPLCSKKLQLEVVEVAQGKVHFRYYCDVKESVRDDSNTATVSKSHYDNECFPKGGLVTMIIPPFMIFHSQANNMTSVYDSTRFPMSPNKLIFRTTLLDLDYSKPHLVTSKLKLLVTFS